MVDDGRAPFNERGRSTGLLIMTCKAVIERYDCGSLGSLMGSESTLIMAFKPLRVGH